MVSRSGLITSISQLPGGTVIVTLSMLEFYPAQPLDHHCLSPHPSGENNIQELGTNIKTSSPELSRPGSCRDWVTAPVSNTCRAWKWRGTASWWLSCRKSSFLTDHGSGLDYGRGRSRCAQLAEGRSGQVQESPG